MRWWRRWRPRGGRTEHRRCGRRSPRNRVVAESFIANHRRRKAALNANWQYVWLKGVDLGTYPDPDIDAGRSEKTEDDCLCENRVRNWSKRKWNGVVKECCPV